jgi:hypothetical protein
MMLMIPAIYQGEAAAKLDEGFAPDPKLIAKMMEYNGELIKAGVLIGLDGLQPISKGARVSFAGGQPTVTDGPFAEMKEVVGGYWIIQVGSKAEALDLARRCPAQDGDVIEIRQIFEKCDFPAEAQQRYVAEFHPS